jgi:hypothetical protein
MGARLHSSEIGVPEQTRHGIAAFADVHCPVGRTGTGDTVGTSNAWANDTRKP